ncbi:DUF3006 domain-containing protein [Ornithinibacillus bavariensis]|uniref:DUF3006 domain-containing protein n=1 Tax=Ornithinibacillus bavariensis TaxID=545502 RepID=UPI000EC383C3|nr:DUF3006 domain-containing protein [Ornithinibacillus sp.]
MKGVFDRIEGNNAVILIEEEKAELVVPMNELPYGSKVNTVFSIDKVDEKYHIIGIDQIAEQEAKEKTSNLLAKLRAKSTGSKFKND